MMIQRNFPIRLLGRGRLSAAGWGRGTALPPWQPGNPEANPETLKDVSGGSRFGRLDQFTRIGLSAMALALADAEIDEHATHKKRNLGIVCSTTSGSSVTDRDFFHSFQNNPQLASPGLFVYTLASSFLGEAALRFGIKGATLSLAEPQPSGRAAISTAVDLLADGDDEIIIAGICNLFPADHPDPGYFSGAEFMVLESCEPPLEAPTGTASKIITADQQGIDYLTRMFGLENIYLPKNV